MNDPRGATLFTAPSQRTTSRRVISAPAQPTLISWTPVAAGHKNQRSASFADGVPPSSRHNTSPGAPRRGILPVPGRRTRAFQAAGPRQGEDVERVGPRSVPRLPQEVLDVPEHPVEGGARDGNAREIRQYQRMRGAHSLERSLCAAELVGDQPRLPEGRPGESAAHHRVPAPACRMASLAANVERAPGRQIRAYIAGHHPEGSPAEEGLVRIRVAPAHQRQDRLVHHRQRDSRPRRGGDLDLDLRTRGDSVRGRGPSPNTDLHADASRPSPAPGRPCGKPVTGETDRRARHLGRGRAEARRP